MTPNLSPENHLALDNASPGHATQEFPLENDQATSTRRWELCPEIVQGQTMGWKVVRLN